MQQSSVWIVIPHMDSKFTENNLVDNRMLATESNLLHSMRSTTIEFFFFIKKSHSPVPLPNYLAEGG